MSSIFRNTFARSKSGPFLTAGGPVKAAPEVFAKMTKTTAEE
jgi:hypothetical protein